MKLTEKKEYYNNGQLCHHWFEDKNRTHQGEAIGHWPNGNIQYKRQLMNGKFHGESISYHENGRVIEHDVWINDVFHANYEDLSDIDRFELSMKHGIEWLKESKVMTIKEALSTKNEEYQLYDYVVKHSDKSFGELSKLNDHDFDLAMRKVFGLDK